MELFVAGLVVGLVAAGWWLRRSRRRPAVAAAREMYDKRETVAWMLEHGSVHLHLDATHDGVVVPEHLREDPQLVLRIGYDLDPQIPDLALDADGVSGTLRFGGRSVHCRVPWTALFAAKIEGRDKGMLWTADVPPAVATYSSSSSSPSSPSEDPSAGASSSARIR